MAMPVCALEWDNETLRRAQIEMTGYLDSALLRNYKSLDIDMARKSLKLAMPVPNLLTLSWQQKLKELPGAEVKVYLDKVLGGIVELSIPLTLLLEKTLDSATTKGGDRAIGQITGLDSRDMSEFVVLMPEKSFKLRLYKGTAKVAMLVEVPYDPLKRLAIPIKNKIPLQMKRETLGYVHTVPQHGSVSGGFLMSAEVPKKVLEILGK